MFLRIIVKESSIQIVFETIKFGKDFFILNHIERDDVNNGKKNNHHNST